MSYPTQWILILDDRAFGPMTFDIAAALLWEAKEHDRLAFITPFYPVKDVEPYLDGTRKAG